MDDDKGSPEFTVRALRQGDLPGIVNLRSVMSNVLAGVQSISAVQNTLDRSAESHEAWIVEIAGTFIGLAVVFIEGESVAHLKLIYVAPDVPQRHQIIRALVEMTMRDIWERGSLKLIVHTSLPADRFIECLRAFGFEFSRERRAGDARFVEFYRNLYAHPEAFGGPNSQGSNDHGILAPTEQRKVTNERHTSHNPAKSPGDEPRREMVRLAG